jgi:hypothetical protein
MMAKRVILWLNNYYIKEYLAPIRIFRCLLDPNRGSLRQDLQESTVMTRMKR